MERFGSDGRSGREDLEMSLTEQDLIKLMLRDARYMELPADVAGRAFVSDAGNSLYRALHQIDWGSGHVDYDRLKDFLDEDAETATNELFLAYQENCIAEGQEILNRTEFSRTFSGIIRSMPSVSPIKRTNGQDSRGYRGIRLTD